MSEEASASSVPAGPTSAAHVIAGFRYQLLQSIATLIALKVNETLHLEVSEDFSVTAAARAASMKSMRKAAAQQCHRASWSCAIRTVALRRRRRLSIFPDCWHEGFLGPI
jgi:hypothetical protein